METGRLILSRREGQQIFVGDDIVITVLDIDDNGYMRAPTTRLAIEAPKDVRIVRQEIARKELDDGQA